jgi:hypothetical protein
MPIQEWLDNSTGAELIDGIVWLQKDAAYSYKWADIYRETGDFFAARKVQEAAAWSARYATAGLSKLLSTH